MLSGSARKVAAAWRQWVALPQREPFTEWWRHQTQSARTISLTGPTAALAPSFDSGFSPVLSPSPLAPLGSEKRR
ncbi:hypothetical protein D4764_11G0000270 [Takifugu flavidus]|uniref:Uncharacterized protein n=1 Tax=Takifugu flavidus TaxID=433684 RepID=A0A5C6PFY9_9TELE|nr:hypothetical protein D4764_11G0000270 [Takifugu flavidus]